MSIGAMLLKSLLGDDKSDKNMYQFDVLDEDNETVFSWYVVDATCGYNVFRCLRPADRKTEPEFQQWFKHKHEAIEYAVDQGRAEKLAKGL